MLWKKLNAIVEKKGMGTPMFKGFMVDSVQTKWNVVWIVYGTRNPTFKMVDKKRMCF
jgi:hypothetical protein